MTAPLLAAGLWIALVCLAGCDVDAPDSPMTAAPRSTSVPPRATALPLPSIAVEPCTAPSLRASGPLDARDEAALASCVRPSTGPGSAARECGKEKDVAPIDHARLAAAVRPLDLATLAHVRSIAAKGRAEERRTNAFGLVGDSMTVSGAFLRARPRALDPIVAKSLENDRGESIIDWYAGAKATRIRGAWTDSFGAPRAAKVGARAPWPLVGGEHSPLMTMVRDLSPAVAVVLFGGNDAAYTSHKPLDELSDTFARDLEAVIDALEARGIIPVLNTLARHGSAPGFEDCAAGRELTNWRIAVQTNALSARVVEIACRRHLPLIDVRDALDTAVNLGLGPDQIHPSGYALGPEILDPRGLRCGYNVRNYVTLLMLRRIRELVFERDASGNRATTP